MKTRRRGFTLIEMMVVIGIIGILAGALAVGFTKWVKSAQRAKAMEAVSNARTALETLYMRKDNTWPPAILNTKRYNGYHVMDEDVARVLFQNKLLNVDCKGTTLRGVDRCGIVDPWAQDVLRKADQKLQSGALLTKEVSSGGRVQDHWLYFAVDQNEDGFVDSEEGAPVRKVRAKVIVWCAGADGGLGDCKSDRPKKQMENGRSISNGDNVYSWQRGQEER